MPELIELVSRGIALAEEGGRADLGARLGNTLERIGDPVIRVLIVGAPSQGKSSLLNALVGAPVSPVDDVPSTSVPITVRYGPVATARLHVARIGDGALDPTVVRTVEPAELADRIADGIGEGARVSSAEVELPRDLLAAGLALVDSPGIGGPGNGHALGTLTALPTADAMLLVSDASQEYTEPELQLIRHALKLCPNVACVLSKIDLYPHWREIAELDRAHLDTVNRRIPLFAVSSDLRAHATRLEDAELNAESGFSPLVSYLRDRIVGGAEHLRERSVAREVLTASEQLGLALSSELTGIEDPEAAQRLVAEMESAKERASELRRTSARWQVTLADGVGDLMADMDHDLRDRMRSVQREAERAIDVADPGPAWDPLVDWLDKRIESAISDTFIWTDERAGWLSSQVAAHFSESPVTMPEIAVGRTDDLLDAVELIPELDDGKLSLIEKVLTGLRGSYGGVLMVGLITGIMGMALINPFSVAAGIIIGAKVYYDDKQARLKKRQSDAKAIVRRQVDDVIFQVGKQLRDRLRLVQRTIRDHYTDIAEEYHRSLLDSVAAAHKGAAALAAERGTRAVELRDALARVEALTRAARELGSAAPASAAPPAEAPASPRQRVATAVAS